MIKKADAVFEGGGVKGIGLVGALDEAEKRGYQWQRVAGTSAGAIVATLLAAGYKAVELKKIIGNLDYHKFKDKGAVDRIPLFGSLISLLTEKGIYEGDYFESWISDLLKAKGLKTFGDLNKHEGKYRLNVICSDISNGRLVVLPRGVSRYGVSPDKLSIARAVRMSMSIPFFFEPIKLKSVYFVDGGLLSNFPVWLFDSKKKPRWPTFGFKLVEPESGKPNRIKTPIDFTKALITTMLEAHDKRHIEEEDYVRTIGIPTMGVGTTEFDLSPQRRDRLFSSGVRASKDFFSRWNFNNYIKENRTDEKVDYESRIQKDRRSMVF